MRVLVFYEMGDTHPSDYHYSDGDELVKNENIVRMYQVDNTSELYAVEQDYNEAVLGHSGFWCKLVDVSKGIETEDEKGSDRLWDYAAEIAKQIAFSRNEKLPVYAEEWGQEIIYNAFKKLGL